LLFAVLMVALMFVLACGKADRLFTNEELRCFMPVTRFLRETRSALQ
jgi:hypothetical protein